MIETNKYNLPPHVLRILSKRYPPKADSISVSALIDSPRIRTLLIQKWDEITQDVSVGLTALGGISLHQRAESFTETDEQAEHKLKDFVDSKGNPLGLILVGKADNYVPARQIISMSDLGTTAKLLNDNQIRDWKSMGIYGLKWPDKIDKMTAQLNCYAYQRRLRKQVVESLWLDVYWKNWKYEHWERARDKLYGAHYFCETTNPVLDGYPPIAYTEIKLPLWSFEYQEEYVQKQIEYHIQSPMSCDDRWQSEPEFAVMKIGRKSALRVLSSPIECIRWCAENDINLDRKDVWIVERPGKCIRCSAGGLYCNVWSICSEAIK